MGEFQDATNALLRALSQLAALAGSLLTAFEVWLRDRLQAVGVPHTLQTAILIGVTVLLVLGALRLFAGLVRVAIVLILVLLVLHLVLPVIQG
jgi:hypothetical protein